MHTETTTAIDPTTTTHAPIAFPDGEFRLFCASFGSAYGDARKVFRVRVDRDPHERAAEKGIRGYDRIVAVGIRGDLRLLGRAHRCAFRLAGVL